MFALACSVAFCAETGGLASKGASVPTLSIQMWMETRVRGHVLPLIPGWFVPFHFMSPLRDYLCLTRFGPVVCRSSCPFQGCECRLPSKRWLAGIRQPTLMTQTRSFNRPLPPAPAALSLTQSALSVLLLLDLTQASYLASSCGLHSGVNRALLLFIFLSFISLCPLPIYFPSPNSPSWACCSAFTHQPPSRKACPQWIHWPCASQPALSGERGYLVVLFKP